MATKGISEAFAKYGARLKNVNWSVSAWNSTGELVLSLWAHHYRKGEDGSAEYSGKLSRWAGPGNNEFRVNIAEAFERKSPVRLVVVQTDNIDHVESGEDASRVKKDFSARDDLVGEVVLLENDNYVVSFRRR
ncbi:hypothetical protein [Massilia sp. TWR1-2-2]|uniref:hypothetical protein n=1 Tax=Massilia sp. TWR1-2-2 TaxID=2804584 RepID=UPI003CE6BB42